MHLVIFGAGAVGATLGVWLHRAGQEVLLVGRPATVAAMTAGTFTLLTPTGPIQSALPATTTLSGADVRPDSAVLLCVKSHQIPAAIDALRAVAPPTTPIACLQNGIRAESLVHAAFPNTYSVLNVFSAVYTKDGEVRTGYAPPAAAWLEIGRYQTGVDDVCQAIVANLQAAGIVALRSERVQSLKYGKLLGNLSNAVRAIADAMVPSVADLAREEAEDVFRTAGIKYASLAEIEDRTTYLRHWATACSGNEVMLNRGSTWQSLVREVDTEVDDLNGEIVRLAAAHGGAAPVNELLVELVHAMERDRRRPGWLTPTALVERCLAARSEGRG